MRLDWLDILKGIGIFSVVVGHVLQWRYVYCYHIPLFFLISGYTYHPRNNEWAWGVKCFQRFMVPYFSYLICLNLLTLILYGRRLSIYKSIVGGKTGWSIWSFLVYNSSISLFDHIQWFG